jgi:uncharacterized membrane protein YdbT with pleckstrin-like domain
VTSTSPGRPDPYHLTEDETLLLDLRPHWVRLLPSGARALAATIAASWLGAKLPASWPLMDWLMRIIWLGAALYLVRFAVDLARWWFTHFAITSERIIVRSGVISRNGVEIPLDRVNTVFFEQRIHERLLGAGDITIESASEQGRQRFDDVKNPNQVQQRIYQAREELASRARRLQGEEIARGIAAQQRADEENPPPGR